MGAEPFAQVPINPNRAPHHDSPKNSKTIDWVLRRLEASAKGKETIEREALVAARHYASFLDVTKHPFPSKTYDPIFFATRQGRISKAMESMFSNPPLHDFKPRGRTTWDQARKIRASVEYHDLQTRPRGQIQDFLTALGNSGTGFFHIYWDHREAKCACWRRKPMQVPLTGPDGFPLIGMDGQPQMTWVDGAVEYVNETRVVMDSPRVKNIPIWQMFPDDTVNDIQDGDYVCFVDYISTEEARSRVKTSDWKRSAVEKAIDAECVRDARGGALGKIMDRMKWLEEIGLAVSSHRDAFDKADELQAVEVIECWRRRAGGIERIVILNRVAIAWMGDSPYQLEGKYPFLMSRNYRLEGQFWGLSDFHIIRWLLMGVQTLRNAGVTESVLNAMPPMMLGAGVDITGKRYEPRAEWRISGSLDQVRMFESSGRSIQFAEAAANALIGQMDRATGSSEVNRGSAQATKGIAATNVNLAFEAAGIREKVWIDDQSDAVFEPMGDMKRLLVQQFQRYAIDVNLDGNRNSPPVTVFPDMFEDADFYSIPTVSTSAVKALKQKQAADLYELIVKYQEPGADRQAALENYVEQVAPEERANIVLSREQIQQQQMQQQMAMAQQQGGMPPGQPGGQMVSDQGGQGGVNDIAAQLREAMAYG